MGEQESAGLRRARAPRVDWVREEELARGVARNWTEREATAVLLEQGRSGLSVPAFAERHGYSGSRLYYWRKRLSASASGGPEEPEPPEQPEALATVARLEPEQELAPGALQRALARELCPEAVGDRQVQQYVMRAVGEEDKMWRVFELSASGSVLMCVVRWVGSHGPKPYSLVELLRTEPALRWRDFARLKEALDALDKRKGSRGADPSKEAVALLLPVQVRDSERDRYVATAEPWAGRRGKRAVTVDLHSGVRIRIPNGAEPELVRTVLGMALGAQP